jgi:2-iminobutanoate/2-iminopropanoate deaminase
MTRLAIALLLALAAAEPAWSATPAYYPPQNPQSPYSEAVRAGGFLIVSGQLGIAPDGAAQSFEAEARRAMDNVAAILARHGSRMDQVVKCTVMLADMGQWAAFNAVYTPYFKPGRLPARSVFGSSGLAAGARLEVECWAYVGEGGAR